jgi:phosphatidylinositol alpha-1,6-mannosyltransferase
MKSLLISCDYFPPEIGGISQLMNGITSALGPKYVCCLTGQRADTKKDRLDAGVRVYRRPAIFNAKWRALRGAAWAATIAEIMVRERPQVTQLSTAGEGERGIRLRKWFGLPFVIYAHGNEVLNAMQKGAHSLKVTLQAADRVLAVSQYTANLVQKLGIPPERIEIVHPGCDIKQFRPLSPSLDLKQKLLNRGPKEKVILTVGNLVPRKGHDMVIRALRRLREAVLEVTYLIVGEGPCRVALEKLTRQLGVHDRVVFAGRVPTEELPQIYAISDVFVMPSLERVDECDVEGFGIVFLEASACAKPVVGSRSGGIPDAVREGITGLLVNGEDPDEIAAALARILSDHDLAVRFGQQGREWISKNFGWSRTAEKVQCILEQVSQEKIL